MNSHLFFLFLITSAANIAAPGLGVAVIVMTAAEVGLRRSLPSCLGIALGITVLFAVALSGIGVVVAASPVLFSAIKLAGALFILWLAWHTWRKPAFNFSGFETAGQDAPAKSKTDAAAQFVRCALISLTNPQPIIFGVSVLPQFIDPARSYAEQSVIMIALYTLMVFLCMIGYAAAASRARVFLSKGKGPLFLKRASAGVFAVIGVALLFTALSGLTAA